MVENSKISLLFIYNLKVNKTFTGVYLPCPPQSISWSICHTELNHPEAWTEASRWLTAGALLCWFRVCCFLNICLIKWICRLYYYSYVSLNMHEMGKWLKGFRDAAWDWRWHLAQTGNCRGKWGPHFCSCANSLSSVSWDKHNVRSSSITRLATMLKSRHLF